MVGRDVTPVDDEIANAPRVLRSHRQGKHDVVTKVRDLPFCLFSKLINILHCFHSVAEVHSLLGLVNAPKRIV
jgi:hypothetical protein